MSKFDESFESSDYYNLEYSDDIYLVNISDESIESGKFQMHCIIELVTLRK